MCIVELNKTINQNEVVNGKEHVSPVIKKFIAVNQETRQRLKEFETSFDFMFEALEQVHEPVLALEHALVSEESIFFFCKLKLFIWGVT